MTDLRGSVLRRVLVVGALFVSITVVDGVRSAARADDGSGGLRAVPAVFVGTAPGCAPSPPGSSIVTSAWLLGIGLPDNGSSNVTPSDPPNHDPHRGLLLSKNGATADCAAAEARILGVSGIVVSPTFALGFDFRNGGHCGAGAPRFNVEYQLPGGGGNGFSFVGGCADTAPQPAPQDMLHWTRVTFDSTVSFPPIPPGSRIQRITLILDEGTDNPTAQDPMGIGLAVVDNININGRFITAGTGLAPSGDSDDGRREDEDADFQQKDVPGGGSADMPMTADANSLSVGGRLDDGQLLVMEIYNPAGVLVGASLPAVGPMTLNVPALVAGTYTLRVRNLGLTTVTTTITTVKTVLR